jgi:hypothetical protein
VWTSKLSLPILCFGSAKLTSLQLKADCQMAILVFGAGSIAADSHSLLVSRCGFKTAPKSARTLLQQSFFLPTPPPQTRPLHGSRLGLQLCSEFLVVKSRALPDLFEDFDLDDDDSDLEDASFILPEELKDRPRRGFGGAQAYDTSVEDELIKEIESTKQGFTKKRQAGDAPVAAKSSGGAARKSRPPLRKWQLGIDNVQSQHGKSILLLIATYFDQVCTV